MDHYTHLNACLFIFLKAWSGPLKGAAWGNKVGFNEIANHFKMRNQEGSCFPKHKYVQVGF